MRVAAAGIQFVETMTRAGQLRAVSSVAPNLLPWIPGREVAGDVIAVGEGVNPDWIGRRVAGLTAGISGGYAELALVEAAAAHHLNDGLGFPEAVSLLGTGRTALGLNEAAEVGKGDTVLVESAAGAVGVLSMQLAHAAGAQRVIGLARGAEKLAIAESFGADVAIDYSADDWPEQVRAAAPEGVTVVFDAVGGRIGAAAFELLADGGRFVIFGFSDGVATEIDPNRAAEHRINVVTYFGPPTGLRSPEAQQRLSREVFAAASAGRLRTFVGRRFPLDQAADAHAAIAGRRTVGKTVLEP